MFLDGLWIVFSILCGSNQSWNVSRSPKTDWIDMAKSTKPRTTKPRTRTPAATPAAPTPPAATPAAATPASNGWRKYTLGIGGALILAVMANGVWEFLAKPGMTGAGRYFLDTVTFHSNSIKDSAYRNAALDPTSVPSLVLMSFAYDFPLISATFAATLSFIMFIRMRYKLGGSINPKPPTPPSFRGQIAGICLMLIGWLCLKTITSFHAQTNVIWRVFNANVTICAPFITEQEAKQLKSKFAAMTTRAEYQTIDKELRDLAEKHGITSRLRKEQLW